VGGEDICLISVSIRQHTSAYVSIRRGLVVQESLHVTELCGLKLLAYEALSY
jgi:hypothetical protein